jgi:recombination protein RecR
MHLLRQPAEQLQDFGQALIELKQNIQFCNICFNITIQNPCSICLNPNRNQSIICVVAKPQDLVAIENTGEYHGLYHVLHGTLNPLEGITPDQLKIKELLSRIKNKKGEIKEIILAFNPDMEGEATIIYLTKLLQNEVPKITRLARGLPMGSDLEYADEITLTAALAGRKEI